MMKIEEALEELKAFKNKSCDGMDEEALDVAIKAVELYAGYKKNLSEWRKSKDHTIRIIESLINEDIKSIEGRN